MMNTREGLLLALKQADGWVSGEELSRDFSMSRTAIWKHMEKLREEGYSIESSPRKGYRISGSDLIIPSALREALAGRTFGGQGTSFRRRTVSTNVEARRLAEEGAPEGTLVVAECQDGGRGRRGRIWFSPPGGGLYFSFILRPRLAPAEAAKITLLASVSTAEALARQTGLTARIKWPNDILVNGRKIAGLLAEISTEPDSINYVVLGIGLNINIQDNFDPLPGSPAFPEELRLTATSVLIETGREFPREALLIDILKDFEMRYVAAREDGFASALQRWRELTNVIGKKITVETAAERIEGDVLELDQDGALVLRDPRGSTRRFLSGDIVREKGECR